MKGINEEDSGTHLPDLDGVLDSQNILVSLHDEMSAMVAEFRQWFYSLIDNKVSKLQSYCPTNWNSYEIDIMSHPEVISKLLKNHFSLLFLVLLLSSSRGKVLQNA